jgi:S-adenosylmethionine synthetase
MARISNDTLSTSESVSEGHPDKVADRLSDELLDACLGGNPSARVALETLVTTDRCVVAGETRGVSGLDWDALVRRAIRDIGYTQSPGFDAETVRIETLIHEQSGEIAAAVDRDDGAGDQGLMFGYACSETPEMMPAALVFSHHLLQALARRRKTDVLELGPDAKSQFTLRIVDGKPVHVETLVVSHQHRTGFTGLAELVREEVGRVLPSGLVDEKTRLLINPSGAFTFGGPAADTGLTGRKIIVDSYGGAAPHGGGAFSGKDPSKVDRSGAYLARWVAKNIVAAGLAEKCLVRVAYVIGHAEPVDVTVDTFGTGHAPDRNLERVLRRVVDFTPRGIRERLALARPIYARTAAYGHFGRTPDDAGHFTWERVDLAKELTNGI